MKKILIVIGVMLALILILFIGTGFTKNPNVEIIEYSVNEDGAEIYFNRANRGYELVLQKDIETGEWERPNE